MYLIKQKSGYYAQDSFRYLRVLGYDRWGWDVQFYVPELSFYETPDLTGDIISLNKTAYASSGTAANANNGLVDSNYWQTGAETIAYWGFDAGAGIIKAIRSFRIYGMYNNFGNGIMYHLPKYIQFFGSADNTTWYAVSAPIAIASSTSSGWVNFVDVMPKCCMKANVVTVSNANRRLRLNLSSGDGATGYFAKLANKPKPNQNYYFEVKLDSFTPGWLQSIGLIELPYQPDGGQVQYAVLGASSDTNYGWGIGIDGYFRNRGVATNYNFTAASNDVFGFAVKAGSELWISRNGTWLTGDPATGTNPIANNIQNNAVPAISMVGTVQATFNFGQYSDTPFAYTKPAGFDVWRFGD